MHTSPRRPARLCGTPDEVCEQISKSYVRAGVDQLVFGMPGDDLSHEEALECIEVFGKQVIPEFDKDSVHSTTPVPTGAAPASPEPLPGTSALLLSWR